MSSVLERLDLDVIFCIKTFLNFEDTLRLSLVCRQFYNWLHEEAVCRYTVQNDAGHTLEAQAARISRSTYLEAFKRICQRRAAIATARPYSIRVIGYASAFCKCAGTISWLSAHGKVVSILDLRQPSRITRSLDWTDGARLQLENREANIKLFSCLGNILVIFLETLLPREIWLMVIDVFDWDSRSPKIHIKRKVPSSRNHFIRQSSTHVAYGFQTWRRSSREENHWQIEILSLDQSRSDVEETQSTPNFLRLYPSFGVTIGRDVEFALHKDYFFAVSTRLATKLVDGDWTSFYDCMSVPVVATSECDRPAQWELAQLYRRRASEGPINDAWTTIRLEADEKTNDLVIIETRREWINGSSRQVRSCYAQSLVPCSEATLREPLNVDDSSRRNCSVDTAADGNIRPFIHHDISSIDSLLTYPSAKTKFTSYNFGARSFVDIIADEQTLSLRVSNASNQLISPKQSMNDIVTAQGRTEETILYSKPNTFSCKLPKLATGSEDLFMSASITEGVCEDRHVPIGDNFSACADERCIVFMTGSRGENNRPLLMVSFDPAI